MLVSLQALRAIAAWMVVMHHVMQIFFDFKASSTAGQLFVDKGAVGVDIFFVISGLVIYLSTQGKDMPVGRFLFNRAARIVPAYWLYSLAMALIILFAQPLVPGQTFDWTHFLRSLLFIPAENPAGYGLYPTLGVGWTLNYEMLFYLLFALVFLVPERFRLLLVAAALVAVCEGLTRSGVLSGFYHNQIVYEFLLGLGIGMLYRRGWIGQGLWLPLLILGAALLALYHLDSSQRLLHWGLPSALIVVACVALEPYLQRSRVLKALGNWSYSVYLLHVLVLSLGWYLCRRFQLNSYLTVALCVPLILAGSWLSYVWLERSLYQRLQGWWDARGDAPAVANIS
ncbi:acyltransferase [Pseudomonas sp. UL073]|uniref:Acyltransferase n=1 Tax=Zestomonas insulae TaxID=2809017 RepID=A0ABS2IGE5_9GAMM|nr:acyltransferase [Pseudomonas insulae]MBM7062012.1 acyltransferase [Pseudomonas insulae]